MWVDLQPAHSAQGGQFETLGHTEGDTDQKKINDVGQQQWSTTFDVMEASE